MTLHTETVEPGQELVIVDKPYFFGHEGVRPQTLKEGRSFYYRTTYGIPVVTVPQSQRVRFDDLSSKDNILLDFESTIQYQIIEPVRLVRDFGGKDWFTNNLERQYMAIVREAVKKKSMTEMMSEVDAARAVDAEVTAELQKLVTGANLPIRILGVSLGRAQPNKNVLDQMNETAAQQQRKKTLIEAEAAEVQREKEQVAKARADNAYRNSIGLSPEQFVRMEEIKRYSEACAKSTCIIGTVPVVVGR